MLLRQPTNHHQRIQPQCRHQITVVSSSHLLSATPCLLPYKRINLVMAQKAAKTLAARNVAILNRTLLLSLGFHGTFLLLRFLFLHRSLTLYALLSAPAFLIQFWFERIGRPTHGPNGELKRSGEDLEAKGLTEWMWDVLYWTYICLVTVATIGDYGWWAYVSVDYATPGIDW